MKSQTGILPLLAACALLPGRAPAEYYVGQHNVLYATANASAAYDSNIFTNDQEVSSMIYALTPGIQFIRDAGYIRTEAQAGVALTYYSKDQRYNSQDPFAQVSFNMPFRDEDYPIAAKGMARYAKDVSADPNVGTRVERDAMNANARVDYRFNTHAASWVDATYDYYDYQYDATSVAYDPGFQTSNVIGLEGGAAYRYSSRLNLGLSGRVRSTDRQDWSAMDYAIFAVAEGDLLTRMTGEVRLGAQYRDFDSEGVKGEWSPYARVAVTWHESDLRSWELAVTSDYTPTSSSDSVSSRAVSLTVRQQLVTKIDAYVSLVGEHLKFENLVQQAMSPGPGPVPPPAPDRKDDVLRGVVGMDYTLTPLVGLHGEVSYEDRNSNVTYTTYDRVVARFALKARF